MMISLFTSHNTTAQHLTAQMRSLSAGDTTTIVGSPQSYKLASGSGLLGNNIQLQSLNSELGSLQNLVNNSVKSNFNYLV